MQPVCFTGAGELAGVKISRTDWGLAASGRGYQVLSAVAARGILVASRTDTAKALEARRRGATIMSYAEFAGELRMAGATHVGTFNLSRLDGGRLEYDEELLARERERREAQARVDAKRAARQREQEAMAEALQANPLWGSF